MLKFSKEQDTNKFLWCHERQQQIHYKICEQGQLGEKCKTCRLGVTFCRVKKDEFNVNGWEDI